MPTIIAHGTDGTHEKFSFRQVHLDLMISIMVKSRRLVALFDILGFGHRLKNDNLPTLRRELRDLIRHIRSAAVSDSSPSGTDNLEHTRFAFDSVLLVSMDTNDSKNVHTFIYACIMLMEIGFRSKHPFRGSITLDDVFVDEETGLILGSSFPDLRDAEEMQEWSGCFVHTSAETLVWDALEGTAVQKDRIANQNGSSPLVWHEIPIKDRFASVRPKTAWCLNWVYLLGSEAISPSLDYMAGDAIKQKNTAAFVQFVRNLPSDMQRLTGTAAPTDTYLKALKSRWGMRVLICDRTGKSKSMPKGTKIQFHMVAPDNSKVFQKGTVQL